MDLILAHAQILVLQFWNEVHFCCLRTDVVAIIYFYEYFYIYFAGNIIAEAMFQNKDIIIQKENA